MNIVNGSQGGVFTTLADLQASKPRVGTLVSVNGVEYSINVTDFGNGIAVNGLFANLIKGTTTELINSTRAVSAGDVVETVGFTTNGDGGSGSWRATGNTITASQTPALTTNKTCSDANGNEFELIGAIDMGKLGAPSGGDDTVIFQAAINASETVGEITAENNDFTVDLSALNYGAKTIRWKTAGATFNTTSKITQGTFLDGSNGSVENFNFDVPAGEQLDIYRIFGTQNGAGKLFAFHFDLTAGASSTGTEPVRAVVGNINNLGDGEVKAIRVGVVDSSAGGAAALMAFNGSVAPNANTAGCTAMLLQEQTTTSVEDKATAIQITSTFGNRWANGIVFEQGGKVNDAWFQASLDVTESPNGKFLKFKNGAASIIAECDNLGRFRSTDSIHAGSYTNGVSIDADSVNRTAAAGNMLVQAGTNSGTVLQLAGGGSTEVSISDDGVAIGAATGGRQGSGSINAQSVYDDGVLLCIPIHEALGVQTTDDEWHELAGGHNRLVDEHNKNKELGFDSTLDSYIDLMRHYKAVPGLINKAEMQLHADTDKKISSTKKVEAAWLALDYIGCALLDIQKRLERLECK